MYLLVLAHPGCPGQSPESRKMVVCVCVCVCACVCLYSFHASVNFSFFPISIFYVLFPYCFSNFFIPPPCFLMSAWTIYMWSVLFPSLYFSFIGSVRLHQGISTLLSLPYLWACFGILHVFSSLSFHTCSLDSNFLCCLFVVINCMSITNNWCFGTHSSFTYDCTITFICHHIAE